MGVTCSGWSNKNGTGIRNCSCGSWKQHWINYSGKTWPSICSVDGCSNKPTLGAHIINSSVSGEKIVPMCDSCNGLSDSFNLRGGVTLVSANVSDTCGKN